MLRVQSNIQGLDSIHPIIPQYSPESPHVPAASGLKHNATALCIVTRRIVKVTIWWQIAELLLVHIIGLPPARFRQWLTVYKAIRNERQWNLIQNTNIFVHGYSFDNVLHKVAKIFLGVNRISWQLVTTCLSCLVWELSFKYMFSMQIYRM